MYPSFLARTSRTLAAAAALGLLAAAAPHAARAQNVVTTFNYLNVSNGPFTYGTVSQAAFAAGNYTLTVFNTAGLNLGGTNVNGRYLSTLGTLPLVERNENSTTFSGGSVVIPTDVLSLHPGSAGDLAIVRFTAATAGSYTITGRFQGNDNGNNRGGQGTDTDVHIRLNTLADVFGATINVTNFAVSNDPKPFSFTQVLAAGNTLDFAVGRGADGTFNNDSTGLAATVSGSAAAPEPGSLALVLAGSGFLPLAGIVTRRRRQRRNRA